jgi:hypothetical protein
MYKDQNGRCKICNEEVNNLTTNDRSNKKTVVDHCHDTGMVRGVLCHSCNCAIGLLKDSISTIENALHYLQDSNAKVVVGKTAPVQLEFDFTTCYT